MGKLADQIIARREIEGMIADGKSIVILEGEVLSVGPWLKFHPGGDKAILHMIGRDASEEIRVFVPNPPGLCVSTP